MMETSMFNPFGFVAGQIGLVMDMTSLAAKLFLLGMGLPLPEKGSISCEDVSTDKCGDHVHINPAQEQLVFEALGIEYNPETWRAFVKKYLAIPREYGMDISLYSRNKDSSLHRFGWVRSEEPRLFSQAETCQEGHVQLTGHSADRPRMSGDLKGAEEIEIVAVQLGRGEIVFLKNPFELALIEAAIHAHTSNKSEDGKVLIVKYGDLMVYMPAKYSPGVAKLIVHPNSSDYATLMAAVQQAEQEALERQYACSDKGLAIAAGGLW